jgi:PhzF family phenazine biosynthesis protein
MKKLRERHDLTGFAVVTTDTGDRDVDWHMRFFAPSLGVSEDPVTGSANGPMAAYLLENGLLDKSKKHYSFKGAQGSFIGRQGFVTVTMVTRDNKIELLEISGQAVTVLEGEMRLNVNIPLRL